MIEACFPRGAVGETGCPLEDFETNLIAENAWLRCVSD